MTRSISDSVGLEAVRQARTADDPDRTTMGTAVRYLLQCLETKAPGRTVEVRVPPCGAIQCVQGPAHKRGTPPNVVEIDPALWLDVATGAVSWDDAVKTGRVIASGTRASLAAYLPVMDVPPTGGGTGGAGGAKES